MFASRLPARLETNAVSRAVRAARASGRLRFDLTETNPTAVGLPCPAAATIALAHPRGLRYEPDPLGLPAAREAVAAAAGVSSDRLVLTASTSEAYGLLFKLLCDAADEVLVPSPSYPLFELLTGLDCVRAVPYRLDRAGAWCLDRAGIERGLSPRTRAVLVVSPNNPTGSVLDDLDRTWLAELAAARSLAVIADEVFGDYPLRPGVTIRPIGDDDRVLTFTLGGLSKSAGMPQIKLAWIAVNGPAPLVTRAMDRLAIIADTYLSVSTPVQHALPVLLAAGREVRTAIAARLVENLGCLRRLARETAALTLLEPDGGWSAVVRVPAVESEEALVLRLLDRAGVLVHPGYFFDFGEEAFIVVSLVVRPDRFAEGVRHVARIVAGDRS